jgi:hypothetical protein
MCRLALLNRTSDLLEPSSDPSRLIGMKRLLWLVVLPVIAAGCFGGGGGAASKGTASSTASGGPAATSLRFSYPVWPDRSLAIRLVALSIRVSRRPTASFLSSPSLGTARRMG